MKHIVTLVFAILVLAAVGLVGAPMYLTGPFHAQTAADLELGYLLSQWAPSLTMTASLVGLVLAVIRWRASAGVVMKLGVALGCIVLGACAILSRQSFAERQFAALPDVVRISVADSSHVLPNDLVLGVTHESEAAAYPIPIVGYHHIVNDQLAGEPFVVTY